MSQFNASGSKYLRPIQTVDGCVDVYAVLDAFDVRCPARQHAVKKLLCAGIRGKGDEAQDLLEARDAVDRAVQMQAARLVSGPDLLASRLEAGFDGETKPIRTVEGLLDYIEEEARLE